MAQKFFVGDVVGYIGGGSWSERHIISQADYRGGGHFSYATNRGAWFSDTDFKLIRRADKESFAELDKRHQR